MTVKSPCVMRGYDLPRWGNLRRTTPFSATEETVAIASSLGFTAGYTTRSGFARATGPALERSRFVVMASVTAGELAHRIAYAWPR